MKEITKLYDAVHMPQALENRILHTAPVHERQFRPAAAAAMVLVLLCILGCSPTVRAAVDEWVIITFSGLDITIYEKDLVGGTGGKGQIVAIDTDSTTFAYIEDGRLHFTGNGENLDITDRITEVSPFFYTYQDREYEITLVVGYDGSIENFGTYEFVKKNGAWYTGSGRNFLSMEEEVYPWVKVVWNTLNIPWPVPE